VPDDSYLLDYKGRCSLLIYAQDSKGQPFDQYAIGNYGIEGKEGTFKDAEDGELSGNPIEHGGVDTVLRVQFKVEAKGTETVDYWIVAAASQYDAEKIHDMLKRDGVQARADATRAHWHNWMGTAIHSFHQVDRDFG
jgi:GH15 family glucan-1,4-alpha-glucosidase